MKINFNRSIDDKCYEEFPILNNTKVKQAFLRLPDHRLILEGTEIKCNQKKTVFIKTTKNSMVIVFHNGSTKGTEFNSAQEEETITIHEDMQGISNTIENDKVETLLPLSLLQIITKANTPLIELRQIHEQGEGGIMAGVGRTVAAVINVVTKSSGYLLQKLGSTVTNLFEGVTNGSTRIMKLTSKGVSMVVSSTGRAVEEAEMGFSEIVSKFLGGFMPLTNSLLIVGLVVYLWYRHNHIQRLKAVEL